jgi:hypothetical protein
VCDGQSVNQVDSQSAVVYENDGHGSVSQHSCD